MQNLLSELGLDVNETGLDELLRLFSSAQRQRFETNNSDTDKITRGTAIVVLAQVEPGIEEILSMWGLKWENFRREIGLTGIISPAKSGDIVLHRWFEEALGHFARKHPDRPLASPWNMAAAIVEMVAQNPNLGKLRYRLEDCGLDKAFLPADFTFPEPPDPNRHRLITWICQFKTDDLGGDLLRKGKRGDRIDWQWSQHTHRNAMRVGDPVVYLRQVGTGKDRGGIAGTGRLISNAPLANRFELPDGIVVDGLATRIEETFVDEVIPRDEVFTDPPFPRSKIWQGSVVNLTEDQARRIDTVLRERWRRPLFDTAQVSRTRFISDDAEIDRDLLGRGPLAISLARYFHRMWLENNRITREPGTESGVRKHAKPLREEAKGFVLHIDAPWGGGKTTFANYIAQVLNPRKVSPASKTDEDFFLRNEIRSDGEPGPIFLGPLDAHGKPADIEKRAGQVDGNQSEAKRLPWPEEARRSWIVVRFNAWRNEHVDPPWWVFYQTIRRQCFAAIRREGNAPFWTTGSYQPSSCLENWVRYTVLLCQELYWRLCSPKIVRLLLTTILSALLAWGLYKLELPVPDSKGKIVLNPGLTAGAVIAGLTGAASFLWSLVSVVTESIIPGTASLDERLGLGGGDPFKRFRIHFDKLCRRVRRPILIVIDDIDRCRPKFVVGLIRGMQTILNSPRIIYLVLGDRDWIERAFESEHEKMSDIAVGEEQTFGARFVEKAFQISLLLPDVSASEKSNYVASILTGSKPGVITSPPVSGDAKGPARTDANGAVAAIANKGMVEKMARAVMGGENISDVPGALAKGARALENQIKNKKGDEFDTRSPAMSRLIQRAVAAEVVKMAGSSEAVRGEIAHSLYKLKAALPTNPRQIKRIFNSIAVYQNVAALQGAGGDKGSGTTPPLNESRYFQLVLWIILMTEWPQTWQYLAKYPLLSKLIHMKEAGWKKDAEVKRLPPEKAEAILERARKIRDNTPVMAILDNNEFDYPVKIDKEAVAWLKELTPVTDTPVLNAG